MFKSEQYLLIDWRSFKLFNDVLRSEDVTLHRMRWVGGLGAQVRTGMRMSWPVSRYYPDIRLEKPREAMRMPVATQYYLNRYSNQFGNASAFCFSNTLTANGCFGRWIILQYGGHRSREFSCLSI